MCSTPDIQMPETPKQLPGAPPPTTAFAVDQPLAPPKSVDPKSAKLKRKTKKGQLAQAQGGGNELIIPLNTGTGAAKGGGKKKQLNIPT